MVRDLVDDIVTVSEESLSQALLLCLERAKLVVEPAGAAAVAALMDAPGAVRAAGGRGALRRQHRPGAAAAGAAARHGRGRPLPVVPVRIPDRPGELARLLGELADVGANVLDVEHVRTGPKLHLDEVEVALQLETRGAEHCDAVLSRLRAAGYPLSFH